MIWRCSGRRVKDVVCFTFAPVPPLIVRNLTPFVSGFSGGRVKQHPIANPNRHNGEAFGVRTTWGWVQ